MVVGSNIDNDYDDKMNVYIGCALQLLLLSMCPVPYDLNHRALIITIKTNQMKIIEPNKASHPNCLP